MFGKFYYTSTTSEVKLDDGKDPEIAELVAYLSSRRRKPIQSRPLIHLPEEPRNKQLALCEGSDAQIAYERACARYEVLGLCAALSAHGSVGRRDTLREGK